MILKIISFSSLERSIAVGIYDKKKRWSYSSDFLSPLTARSFCGERWKEYVRYKWYRVHFAERYQRSAWVAGWYFSHASLVEGAVLMPRQRRSRAYCVAVSDCRSLLAFVERINGWCATWTGWSPDAMQNGEGVREGRERGSRKNLQGARYSNTMLPIYTPVFTPRPRWRISQELFEMWARVENPSKYFESVM